MCEMSYTWRHKGVVEQTYFSNALFVINESFYCHFYTILGYLYFFKINFCTLKLIFCFIQLWGLLVVTFYSFPSNINKAVCLDLVGVFNALNAARELRKSSSRQQEHHEPCVHFPSCLSRQLSWSGHIVCVCSSVFLVQQTRVTDITRLVCMSIR